MKQNIRINELEFEEYLDFKTKKDVFYYSNVISNQIILFRVSRNKDTLSFLVEDSSGNTTLMDKETLHSSFIDILQDDILSMFWNLKDSLNHLEDIHNSINSHNYLVELIKKDKNILKYFPEYEI